MTSADPSRANILYLAGRDSSGSMWSGQYDSTGSGTFNSWQFGGAAAVGQPSITAGTDGVAYIAIRSSFDDFWMGSVLNNTWNPWRPGGGVFSTDPSVARVGTSIYTAAVAPSGAAWYNSFAQGATLWGAWASPGGSLTSLAAAGSTPQFFFAGKDANDALWWYDLLNNTWTYTGAQGLAAGPLASAPR